MNPQACDKGYENDLNMKAEEGLGFKYIRRIFDCFIKRSSFKVSDDDMEVISDLLRLLYATL
jgi:hypothetical protein